MYDPKEEPLEGVKDEPDPEISVIMGVYNAGGSLSESIASVLNQTHSNFEFVIVDDCSTDKCWESLDQSLKNDSRIKYYRNVRNLGHSRSLNFALDVAKGSLIARMDQDDISRPDRFALQRKFLYENPEVDLVGSTVKLIDESGMELSQVDEKQHFGQHALLTARPWDLIRLPHPTWMARSDWYNRFRYAVPAPYLCEDQEILLRSYSESRFACTPEALLEYRVANRPSLSKLLRTRRSYLRIQLSHFVSHGMYKFAFLSLGGFLLKLARDVIRLRPGAKPLRETYVDAKGVR
jgi:glycosyltransferase involved in cell wall biosynthesis